MASAASPTQHDRGDQVSIPLQVNGLYEVGPGGDINAKAVRVLNHHDETMINLIPVVNAMTTAHQNGETAAYDAAVQKYGAIKGEIHDAYDTLAAILQNKNSKLLDKQTFQRIRVLLRENKWHYHGVNYA
jgi:hypothetical protein